MVLSLKGKIKVFWNGLGTLIQNPGGSSLAVVLTRDCLSLMHNTSKPLYKNFVRSVALAKFVSLTPLTWEMFYLIYLKAFEPIPNSIYINILAYSNSRSLA